MPFCLLFFGTLFLVAGVRDKAKELNGLLVDDFTGEGNFLYWLVAIVIIGSVGYIPRMKKLSDAFLALVVLVMFLHNGNPSGSGGGFFQQFTSALNIKKGTEL
jgi:hypothetical protein